MPQGCENFPSPTFLALGAAYGIYQFGFLATCLSTHGGPNTNGRFSSPMSHTNDSKLFDVRRAEPQQVNTPNETILFRGRPES
jgi:hypothetical protein